MFRVRIGNREEPMVDYEQSDRSGLIVLRKVVIAQSPMVWYNNEGITSC